MTDVIPEIDLTAVVNLDDFEPLARERMAGPAFDYVAGGAWDEVTLREAPDAWRRFRFMPRVLRDVRSIDVSGAFLGRPARLPVAIAPMAAQGLAHPGAEAEMAAGAATAGIPFCHSTSSSMTIEEVAAAAPEAERWFQLYVVGGLDYSRTLVERAEASGCTALVVTVDLPVLSYRERDKRSRFLLPALPNIDAAGDERLRRYGDLLDQRGGGLTWETLEDVRRWTSLPVVLKGILAPEDARRAVELGVDAVVVSTHGGRQLDRAISSVDALPAVVEAAGGRCEVWVDGGIRRGLDIVAAIALGANAVLLGRPLYWALAAAGRAGVERALGLLRAELELSLALLGCTSLDEVGRELIASQPQP